MLTIQGDSDTKVETHTDPQLVVNVTEPCHDIGPMITKDRLWTRMVWWVTHFA